MTTITGIYEIRGVYHISLDGREEFKLDKKTFNKLKLSEGDEIDPDEISEKIAAYQLEPAYEAALSMLDKANKTSAQVKSGLLRRGYDDVVADKCVIRLINAGLIDDLEYAKRMADSQSSKSLSIRMLKQKMRLKGLSASDIDCALERVSSDSQSLAVNQLAEKYSRRYDDLAPREAKRKVCMALARRGFDWDDINSAVNKIYEETNDY